MPPGLPSGSIARGSLFSIFGARLGPDSSPSLAFPLSTTLGGVSVKVLAPNGGPSADVIPVFVSFTQINAIMPSNAPLGNVSIQVTNSFGRGNFAPVSVVNSSFGAFAIRAGVGPGIFQNFIAADNQPINSATVAAMPGQAVTLWGTGLGPVTFPDNAAPTPGNVATRTELFVGGKAASLLYNGRAPCCAGVDQVVFTIPADAPTGCFVPVTVRTEGSISSNTVTLAISADGSPCSDSFNPLFQTILTGGRFGSLTLVRTNTHSDLGPGAPQDVTADSLVVDFRQESVLPFPFNPDYALPPPGACTAYGATGDLTNADGLPLTATTGSFLNAGPQFTAVGPRGQRLVMAPQNAPLNWTRVGKNIPGSPLRNSLFADPGDFTIQSAGGKDVGAFQAKLSIAQPVTWTNRDQLKNIDRTQPLTISWSGGPSNVPVAITGLSADLPTNASAQFQCIAPAGATSFTIPSYILANIAPSRTQWYYFHSYIYVGSLSFTSATGFTATGLTTGFASGTTVTARRVLFK